MKNATECIALFFNRHRPLPVRQADLLGPRHMQTTGIGAFGERRAPAYRAACANRDGCDQHAVAAKVYMVANHGAVLIGAFLYLLEMFLARH